MAPYGSHKDDGALTSDSITVTPYSDPSGIMQENKEEPATPWPTNLEAPDPVL